MKKLGILFFIFLFGITGCMKYTELNHLSIVNTIGIEKENNLYKVTIAVVDPNNYENEDHYEKNIYEAMGDNLTVAFNHLYLYLDKEIYIEHLETLILSNTLNHKDIDNINAYFNNKNNNRNSFTVVYTNSKIKDIVSSTTNINRLIQTNSENISLVHPLTYENYLKVLYEKKYSFIPTIRWENNELAVVGYSYFYNNKPINLLTQEENISYNILNNDIDNLNLSIENKYYSISSLDTTLTYNNDKTDITITSLIYSEEKEYIKKYNKYIKNIITHFIEKYSYFDEYTIKTYTKGETNEK